jgi:hypothetical protein
MKAEAPTRDRSFGAAAPASHFGSRRGPRSSASASAPADFDPGAAVTRATQIAVANAVAFVAAKRSGTDRPPASPIAATATRAASE